MILLSGILNRLYVRENFVNNVVNESVFARFIEIANKIIRIFIGKTVKNSFIINHLNSFFFMFLIFLVFLIPFATSGILGAISILLILISFVSFIFTHRRFELSAFHFPIMIFLGIMLISVGFSTLFISSLKGFAKMFIYIGVFFSFFEYFKKNPEKIFMVVIAVAISNMLELLVVFKQMIFGVEELAGWQDKTALNPELALSRIYGSLKPANPNLLAAYLLATTPCVFALSALSFFKRTFKRATFFTITGILSLYALIQTGCRGAYIGIFFAVLLACYLGFNVFKKYLPQNKNIKRMVRYGIFAAIILALALVLTNPSLMHRVSSIFTLHGDSSNSYRMNVYISSLKMFADNFWIGIGPGNTTFRLIYGMYMVTGFDALGAYNIYLETAVESGIFALLAFLWIILLTFIKSIKTLFATRNIRIKLLILNSLTIITALLVHGFFDTIWFRPQIQLLFWLNLAILAVLTLRKFSNGRN